MNILKADIEDHEILTSITKRSKAYWGFSESILKEWEYLLTVTKDYIEKNEVYKLVHNEQIIGYYSYFISDEKTIKLDNIFILPEFIGKGLGKALMDNFLKNAQGPGTVEKITLDAEPKAENFYKIFGFKTVGHLKSSIKDRYLHIMELQIQKRNRS